MRFFRSATRGRRLQPNRRSGVRIVTLKNAAWAALSVTVLFILVSVYMEFRSRGGAEYGRLYDRRIETTHPPPAAPRPEIVEEAAEPTPVRYRSSRRDELLGVTPATAEPAAITAPAAAPPVRRPRGDGRIVISGGADGVRMDVKPPSPRPQPDAVQPPPPDEEPPATTTEPPR